VLDDPEMPLILLKIDEALSANVTNSREKACKYFKTTAGSYAEHDEFMGVTVPHLRKIAKDFSDISLSVLQELLSSKINEKRLLALLILVGQYQKADVIRRQELYEFYLNNLASVNNWNLVDSSAHLIIGAHIWNKECSILEELCESDSLWERRISIIATWYFIRKNDLAWTFKISKKLFNDDHDLIHKAVGWMLREAGKRDESALVDYLNIHSNAMPRTTLRYAIERLPTEQRRYFLSIRKP
jgi:3-methyladenine DNA glycosylase AlkD